MKRLIELLKMFLYVVVTIVLYFGVNQMMLIIEKSGWLEKQEIVVNWWESFWLVQAQGAEDWLDEDLYIEVIDEYLAKRDSPMTGSGVKFIENAKKYNLPKYLMVAMAGTESNFGKTGYAAAGSFNAVGLGVHEGRSYENWDEGIEDMARVLRNYYFDEGLDTTFEIQNKWAPRCTDGNSCDNSWSESTDYFINELNLLENQKKGEI